MPTITGSKGSYRFSYDDRLDHRDTRGSMIGALFRGTCLDTQREVAIKLLGERAVANRVNIARTRAVVAAGIRHEQVVELIDFCEEEDLHGDTYYFVVMELLRGENLADKLNRHFETHQAPFSEAEVLQYARQALLGLSAIHEKGLVHRDIDPSNLMDCGDVAKIIDLDIAYGPRDGERTNRGTRLGKLSFMPPEQIEGEESPAPDWDLYALGISMYQLLTGKLPYAIGEEAPTIHAIKTEPLPPNSRIAPWLFRVLKKATAKKSKDRYQNAEELLAALERPASRRPPLLITRFLYWIVGGVLLAVALWYFINKQVKTEEEENPAPIARIEEDNNGCEAPCTVTLRSVSENTGENTRYYWEDEFGNTLFQSLQFQYKEPGDHRITLRVKNSDGQESRAETTISIRETLPPPVASFTLDWEECVVPCTIHAEADPNASGVTASTTFTWTDGGNTQQGPTATFSYSASGQRTIRLTATNPDGKTGKSEKMVTVKAPFPRTPRPSPVGQPTTPPSKKQITLEQKVKNYLTDSGWTWAQTVQKNKIGILINYSDGQTCLVIDSNKDYCIDWSEFKGCT